MTIAAMGAMVVRRRSWVRPLGENFAAQHFHGARRSLDPIALGWGLAADQFVLPIRKTTGNVWLATFE